MRKEHALQKKKKNHLRDENNSSPTTDVRHPGSKAMEICHAKVVAKNQSQDILIKENYIPSGNFTFPGEWADKLSSVKSALTTKSFDTTK